MGVSRQFSLFCKRAKQLREDARRKCAAGVCKQRHVPEEIAQRLGKSIVPLSVCRETLEECGELLGKSIVPNDQLAERVSEDREKNDRLAEHVSGS
jgi:hypothetical protein